MKRNTIIRFVARLIGVVILIVGIRMIGEGCLNYIEQHQQTNWIIINAEVTDVSSRVRSSSSKHKHSSTVYDITYEYEVNGTIYSDEIRSQPTIRLIGDTIKIKYNPESPETSTTILSPSFRDLIVFVVFGLIFSVLGFFLSGAFALIRKLIRKGKPEEQEELPPEEYIESERIETKKNTFSTVLVRNIIPTIIALCVIFLSIKLSPGTQSTDIESFESTIESAGYIANDSTEKLRQDWQVGSMLKESSSVDNGNIRIDFCIMDTVDSAQNIYNGMTLPITDGDIVDNGGIIHEIYSVENSSTYVAKIRIKNTVVYIYALAEHKTEVVELLKEIGYWKE